MRLVRWLLAPMVILAACTEGSKSPYYCADDSQCRDTSRAVHDPAKLECHPSFHFCYEGCQRDADCRDPSRIWYSGDLPYCDLASHHCVAVRPDGAVLDLPLREAGAREGGQHEGGVDAGLRDSARADSRRDGPAPDLKKPDAAKPDLKKPNGVSCGGGSECVSGSCTDGYCCEKASCGTCMSCALTPGKCTAIAAGPAPSGHCPGDASCGAGTCNGKGACGYTPGTTCKSSTCAAQGTTGLYAQTDFTCGASGTCASKQKACGGYQCDSAAKSCRAACTTHADCAATSVCDRTAAHLQAQGLGVCVDPGLVATVSSGSLSSAVFAALGAGKTHLRVTGGPYSDKTELTLYTPFTIIGVNKPVVSTPGESAFHLLKGSLALQGLVVSGSGSDAGGRSAVYCEGCSDEPCSLPLPHLTLVESEIVSSENPLFLVECDAIVHRNLIHKNIGTIAFGVWSIFGQILTPGSYELVNNVIVKNQATDPTFAAAVMFFEGAVTFVNNTVADNTSKVSGGNSVRCGVSSTELRNSIFWGNSGKGVDGCTVTYSDLQGWTSGGVGNFASNPLFVDPANDNYKIATTSPCVNAGSSSFVQSLSTIDFTGAPRVITKPDVGAYEVQ